MWCVVWRGDGRPTVLLVLRGMDCLLTPPPNHTSGFPFLGNDFFAAVGDCFSAHAIDNPDLPSEELLLEAYAPAVPASLRRRLALCFRDLRELHASGVLSCAYK